MRMKVPPKIPSDSSISQVATPKGILTSITMGEVKGIMEVQKTKGDSGLFMAAKPMYNPMTRTTDKGPKNCWVSSWLSTAAPIAANMAAYNRYPPMKYRMKEIKKEHTN